MAKNEVAVVTAEKFDLQTLAGDIGEAIAEEMDGLGSIPYDKVKIPSGGGLVFEIPTEDEDNPDTEKEIVGVLLFHHPINGYWENKYDGQNNNPDCSSYDGKTGVDKDGCVHNCSTCLHNQFGSGIDEKGNATGGKACKNMHRCYILREGNPVPILLTLPPTSLKGLRDYLGKQVVLKGMRSYQVITQVTLKKEVSSGNITYSRAVFKKVDVLTGEKLAAAKAYAEQIKLMNKDVEITDDDYSVPRPADDNEWPEAFSGNKEEPVPESFVDEEPQFQDVEVKQEELPV